MVPSTAEMFASADAGDHCKLLIESDAKLRLHNDARRHVRTRSSGTPLVLSLTYPHAFCRTPSTVIIRLVQPPTYLEFLNDHLIKNSPVLIGKVLTESWPAFQLWNDKGEINWDYLVETYGTQTVSVTDCRAPSTDSCIEETTLREVIRGWLSAAAEKDQPLLYVKDWHLARWISCNPGLQHFYTTPYLFADDWLNYHYCNFTNDDFRFVYLGIQGTSTPFHKDVYDSYSWSTNVVGRKLWTFWGPNDEARKQAGIELVQEAGETVFVYVALLSPDHVFLSKLTVGYVLKGLAVGTIPLRISQLVSQ